MLFIVSLVWMILIIIYGQNMNPTGNKGWDLYMKYMCPFIPLTGYLFDLLEK